MNSRNVSAVLPRWLVLVACLSLLGSWSAGPTLGGESAGSIGEALKDGKVRAALRLRAEQVTDDNPTLADDSGEALTLRTTLSFRTLPFHGVAAFVEFENVSDLAWDDEHFNLGSGSLSNGQSTLPVIADPELTEANQAYFQVAAGEQSYFRVGREELAYGNQRFVGPVGWRQNHQSFDGASFVTQAVPRTKLSYAFVENVNRITGANLDMDSHLLDVAIEVDDASKLTVYGYLLDVASPAALGLSTRTLGARYAAARGIGDAGKLLYDLEYATQSDAGDNPGNVDAAYLRLELGFDRKGTVFKVGQETLEGSPGDGAFRTPLATLHKWNGWADKFLNTPQDGLVDRYVSVGGKLGGVKLLAVYHDFSADHGDADYGSEIDLLATYKTESGLSIGLKLADYSADDFSADTSKYWLWLAYAFGNE